MRRLISLTAALLLAAPGIAQAAEPPCLTAGEFTSLAGYTLPSIIKGASERCGPTLGADAFLRSGGRDLATRYAGQKNRHWPGAKAAFLKISSSGGQEADKLLRGMPDTSLQGILDATMEGMIAQQIQPERCGTIDRVVRLLSPLPPENTAELIALAVGLGAKTDKARVGKFSICKA